MRLVPLRLWLLSLLSALLQILPFPLAGPVPLWRRMFCWFCLTPLLLALLGKTREGRSLSVDQSAALGYLCGTCWYLGNCYWVCETMHLYGGIPLLPSVGILLLFSLYLGLYHALFAALAWLLLRRYSRGGALWFIPTLWVAVEFARDRITGFPWDLLGYTQVDNRLLIGLAPWTGVFGLSLAIALVNVLWLVEIRLRRTRWNYGAVALAVAFLLSVEFLLANRNSAPAERADAQAVLLQENLKVGAEADGPAEDQAQMLAAFTQLSLHPRVIPRGTQEGRSVAVKPDLIVWPEAPTNFRDENARFRQAMESLAVQVGSPVIVNHISMAPADPDGTGHLYNSASFFSPDGQLPGRYDKMHLVPFGEYTPYKPLFFFAGHLLDELPFKPGLQRSVFRSGGKTYGVFICYESIFGDEVRQFVAEGAQVLVNISDDGWYGDSSAPWEHLDMARMRAIENDRWLLRSTNTGVTAAIDPHGRITASLPRHQRSSILVNFGYRNSRTFYSRHGDWLGWLCAGLSLGAVGLGYRRRREVH